MVKQTGTYPPPTLAAAHEPLLDRKELSHRWKCSIETVKRREKDGTLEATHLPGGRLVRYRLSAVLKAEGTSN